MNPLYRITSIGRPLDPTYPTNGAILVLMLVGAVIGAVTGAGAVKVGVTILLAWIVVREIDPDHPLSAFVGAGFAAVAVLIIDASPAFLPILVVVVLLRIVNRVVGLPIRVTDTLAVLAGVGFASFTGYWIFGLIGTIGFLMDARFQPYHRLHVLAAILAGMIGIGALAFGDMAEVDTFSLSFILAVAIITGGFVSIIANTRTIVTTTDVDSEPLNPVRIRFAMLLALGAGLLMLWFGDAGVAAMSPLWASLFGVTVYRLVR